MRILERVLVRLDLPPWGGLFRVTVGYLTFPAWSRLTNNVSSDWTLFPFLLAVLGALRVISLVLRRLLPCSEPVQAVWAARRRLAKRFDSYQWRKLFWIGLGLALYALLSGQRSEGLVTLTFICLFSGSIGLGIWRHRRAQLGASTRVLALGVSSREIRCPDPISQMGAVR
jgi:hypothetical protein